MSKPRIQDDLYTYVNQEKLDQLVIPDDKPCAGGFQTLAEDVEKIMIGEFEEMSASMVYPNEHLKRACNLFKLAKDADKKEKFGVKPALDNLAIIKELKSVEDFNSQYKSLMLQKISLPLKIMVDTDMKDTKKHCVYIQGPSVILPDASYYKPEMSAQKDMIMGIWINVAKAILSKSDLSLEEQTKYLEDTLAFDSILGGLVKTSEEWSEYINMYNPMNINEVSGLVNTIDFKTVLNNLFGFVPETIIVSEPRYFEKFSEVFNEDNFELYKHWAYVNGLIDACSLLTDYLHN